MSANSATVPTATTSAMAITVAATEVVVAGTTDSVTFSCPGGGSALFAASGASSSDLTNGQLDAGEHYQVTFTDCQDIGEASRINGSLELLVTDASSSQVHVTSTTDNLTVTMPRGTVTLNGSSTATLGRTTSGPTTQESFQWQSTNFSVTTVFGARTSSWTLSDVSLEQSVTWIDDTLSETSYSGQATLSADILNGAWNATLSFDSGVQYDANGVPESGDWTLRLPLHTIIITVADNTATLKVDWWNNGTIDQTYILTCLQLVGLAG